MNNPTAIQVYIRNLAGEYLTGEDDDWSFTTECGVAATFGGTRFLCPTCTPK